MRIYIRSTEDFWLYKEIEWKPTFFNIMRLDIPVDLSPSKEILYIVPTMNLGVLFRF